MGVVNKKKVFLKILINATRRAIYNDGSDADELFKQQLRRLKKDLANLTKKKQSKDYG